MKRTVLFAAVLTLVLASGAAAGERDEKNVVIHFNFHLLAWPMYVGTYTISGAINEEGPAEATAAIRVNDEGVQVLSANKVLHLQQGDINLFVEGPLTPTGDMTVALIGKWRLTGGTGAYAGIKGHGTTAAVGDTAAGTFAGVYPGKVNVK